jgi:hypothetical protein
MSAISLCVAVVFLFSDDAWLGATRKLTRQLLHFGACVELTHWVQCRANATTATDTAWCTSERCRRTPVCDWDSVGATDGGGGASAWGARRYFSKINQRLAIINATMRSAASRYDTVPLFGALDSDIALYRDPFRRAARDLSSGLAGAPAIVFQQEWLCHTAPAQPCVNGGAWLARNGPSALQLLDDALGLMQRLSLPDQEAWQIVVERHHTRALFWPLRTHPSGRLLAALPQQARVCERLHLAHANWLRSPECKFAALDALWRCESPHKLDRRCLL